MLNKAIETLPTFLLTNIQSFGIHSFDNAHEKEKVTEVNAVLDLKDIDVACITYTLLTEDTKYSFYMKTISTLHC